MSDVELPPLPEPDGRESTFQATTDSPLGRWITRESIHYTKDQMLAYARAAVDAALEAAAAKCETLLNYAERDPGSSCAEAIRAMKAQQWVMVQPTAQQ